MLVCVLDGLPPFPIILPSYSREYVSVGFDDSQQLLTTARNYASVIFAFVVAIVVTTYATYGRGRFIGPIIEVVGTTPEGIVSDNMFLKHP